MPTMNFAVAMPALAKMEIAATRVLMVWACVLMRVRLTAHPLTSSADLRRNRQSLAGAICCELFRFKKSSLRAKRSNPSFRVRGGNGLLRCARNDAVATKYDSAISQREAPEFSGNFRTSRRKRAQGMPGARCTRGLVCKNA
jgi:hypothetical protein